MYKIILGSYLSLNPGGALKLNENEICSLIPLTSLEVYNSVYNINNKNNSFQIQLTDEQLSGVDTKLVIDIEYLQKTNQPDFNKTVVQI